MSMPAIERGIPIGGHLPVSMREALERRLRELAGLGLITLAGIGGAALMTWSGQDPSLSHATSRAIRNVVGYPGAIGANVVLQIIGLGGGVGDPLVRAPAVIFGPPGFTYRLVLGLIFFVAMVVTFLIACGLGSQTPAGEPAEIE